MRFSFKLIAFCYLLSANMTNTVVAQQLQADSSFPGGTGASNTIFSSHTQQDGNILLGGSFTTFNGYASKGIIRILPNGRRDSTFNAGTGVDTRINKLKSMSTGKIVAGGAFSFYNSTAAGNIIRLMPDGSVDTSFKSGTGLNNEVLSMDITSDGSIIVAGFFSQYQGQAVTQPIRILSNGQRDLQFNPGGTGLTMGTIADAIVVQPDGKILLGGTFTLYNGVSASKIIRLHADGSRDTSFNTGSGFSSGNVISICLQPDGKILVGGSFTSFNGVSANRFIRLMPDGSRDTTFQVGTGMSGNVRHISCLPDGNVVAAGDFVSVNGITVNRTALLTPYGKLISGISNCSGTNGTVYTASIVGDSTIIIGGAFTQVAGKTAGRISKLSIKTGNADLPQISIVGNGPAGSSDLILARVSGNLNGATNWYWYDSTCGMGQIGSGDTIIVSRNLLKTYFLRGEGSCSGAGPCGSLTVTARPDTIYWTGLVSDRWEDANNWSPKFLPDSFTVVVVNPGAVQYPVIRSNVICGYIMVGNQSALKVESGFILEIHKKD
jgi:uncharacterized delta-60 repeat protein